MTVGSDPSVRESPFSVSVAEALELMGPVLRPQNPDQLAVEHPLVFGTPERGGVRILRSENRSVSGAGFVFFDVHTDPPCPLRIGGIGSVTTHPDYRGRGFASQVLGECEKALHREGCSIALLWSLRPELYHKNGYIEAGVEVDFVVPAGVALEIPRPEGIVLPFEKEKDLEDCFNLYEEHPTRAGRSLEEFSRLIEIPEMEVFVHHRRGRATAYGAIGKGADFAGALHEWGGDPNGVFAIVREFLFKKSKESLAVISSLGREDLISLFKKLGFDPLYGFLGMMKVLDRPRLLVAVAPLLRSQFRIGVEVSTSGFSISGPKGTVEMKDGEFLRFLFGYRGVWGEANFSARSLGVPEIKKNLPIKMFFWGLDSV